MEKLVKTSWGLCATQLDGVGVRSSHQAGRRSLAATNDEETHGCYDVLKTLGAGRGVRRRVLTVFKERGAEVNREADYAASYIIRTFSVFPASIHILECSANLLRTTKFDDRLLSLSALRPKTALWVSVELLAVHASILSTNGRTFVGIIVKGPGKPAA